MPGGVRQRGRINRIIASMSQAACHMMLHAACNKLWLTDCVQLHLKLFIIRGQRELGRGERGDERERVSVRVKRANAKLATLATSPSNVYRHFTAHTPQ